MWQKVSEEYEAVRSRGLAGAREQPVLKRYAKTYIAVKIQTDVIIITITA